MTEAATITRSIERKYELVLRLVAAAHHKAREVMFGVRQEDKKQDNRQVFSE